jgi:hypothetical protein
MMRSELTGIDQWVELDSACLEVQAVHDG